MLSHVQEFGKETLKLFNNNPDTGFCGVFFQRCIGLTILGLTIALAAACVPAQGRSHQFPSEIASLTVSLSPGSPWTASPFGTPPIGDNVAPLGYATASTRDRTGLLREDAETASLAIDGDNETVWSSQQPAPQWFSVLLDDLYRVDRIQMVITQAPAGPTSHEIWLDNGSGSRTLFRRLTNVPTSDGQILNVELDPPQVVSEVFILSLQSPSWVAWREVRVFGQPVSDPLAAGNAPRLTLQPVARGLELPVRVTHAGDSTGRLFVAEKKGRIRIVRNGSALDVPFLDISDRVRCCAQRGLIDMAFPPSYAEKSYFYVSYTNAAGHTVISRFRTTENADKADPDSEDVVLTIEQPAEHHNGGSMAFGPRDGFLYVSSGDGGSFSYPENPALATDTLLSKLLRIDVESGTKPYLVPDSNPFVQTEGFRDEIWATGLRNPGNFAFDPVTGDLFIPDSGNRRREEINFQPATSAGGEDYGWFKMEGNLCFDNFVAPCSAEGLTLPVAEYDHSLGCSVSGGVVFRGPGSPAMQGLFLYADFCSGRLWGLRRPEQEEQDGWQSTLLINAPISISSIGQDQEGNVYVTSFQDGVLYSLVEGISTSPKVTAVRGNVALRGSGRASSEPDSIEFAIDGDPATGWDANQPPPQWYSVLLEDLYLVDQIELDFLRYGDAPVALEVWLGNGSGTRTLFRRLNDIRPAREKTLAIPVEPPQLANEVLVLSLQGSEDVAWREVKVFGTPFKTTRPEFTAPQVRLEEIASGLDLPVLVSHAGDGSDRIFVVEQKGRIRLIKGGRLQDAPFLDISERVVCCGEQGLFGLAFPPSYADNQHFYVSYSNLDGDTIVSRFKTSDDPDRAVTGSEEFLLKIAQPYKVHNGGHLAFGPRDGYLYIGSGDGGTFRDPDNMAQRTDTLLGKILRIDVESGAEPYAVPIDNPFTHSEDVRAEIWALGLRNPWGFAFDRLTGDLFIPDVGGSLREEVNHQPADGSAGKNYGWAVMEGNICFEDSSLVCSAEDLTLPVAEYDHSRGCAVVGGAVSRGSASSALDGMFLYADFCRGDIWGLWRTENAATKGAEGMWRSSLLTNAGFPVSSIGSDEEGNVYAAGYQNGTIFLITAR